MIRFLLSIPAILFSLVWSLFIPARSPAAPPLPAPLPDPAAPSEQSQAEGHEVTDASAKTVGLFVVGLFAVIFTAMAVLGVMYKNMYADNAAMPVRPAQESFRYAPRDKTSIAKDWDAINALARQRLDTYGWTDRANGVARVPVSRAMSLVATEGLPARARQPPDFPPPDQEKLPLMQLEPNADATKFDPER